MRTYKREHEGSSSVAGTRSPGTPFLTRATIRLLAIAKLVRSITVAAWKRKVRLGSAECESKTQSAARKRRVPVGSAECGLSAKRVSCITGVEQRGEREIKELFLCRLEQLIHESADSSRC